MRHRWLKAKGNKHQMAAPPLPTNDNFGGFTNDPLGFAGGGPAPEQSAPPALPNPAAQAYPGPPTTLRPDDIIKTPSSKDDTQLNKATANAQFETRFSEELHKGRNLEIVSEKLPSGRTMYKVMDKDAKEWDTSSATPVTQE